MSKLGEFFQHFKNKYDEEQKRLMRMDQFLDSAEENNKQLQAATSAINNMSEKIQGIENKVDKLQTHVDKIDENLDTISKGTKMELFDTLYHWKKILVDDRGWASEAEKHEVKEIYEVYHDELSGNGQGEVYYNEIVKLPEKPSTNN